MTEHPELINIMADPDHVASKEFDQDYEDYLAENDVANNHSAAYIPYENENVQVCDGIVTIFVTEEFDGYGCSYGIDVGRIEE